MLTEQQKALEDIVQELSPAELRDVIEFARTVKQKRCEPPAPLYDPDDLTDEDMEALRTACLRRFAEEHPDDDWGYDHLAQDENTGK